MECFAQDNNSGKWFCHLSLGEKSPDHSDFGDLRKRFGTKHLMDVFRRVRLSLKSMGLIREVFTFVDASQSGLINKIASTSAEVSDAAGLKHDCPNGGAAYADKGYCINPSKRTLKRKACHNATIKKNHRKGKNKDKDRWLSGIRSPYERVFAHRNKRVRYRG